MRISLALLLAIGCSRSPDAERCDRGVHKVFELTVHPTKDAKPPAADEQAVIDQAVRLAKSSCEAEGLSEAQLDCLLAMKSFEDLQTVGACPAIKAKRPSWLLVGP